jgi:hypothetical protein
VGKNSGTALAEKSGVFPAFDEASLDAYRNGGDLPRRKWCAGRIVAMFSQLGQLEIWCDAPPYSVVQACEEGGFLSPLDVRWCRMSHVVSAEGQTKGNFGIRLWQRFFGMRKPQVKTCTCGQPLPDLKLYGFILLPRKVSFYLLGQCHRCRTMYWDQTLPPPSWMEDDEAELTDSF